MVNTRNIEQPVTFKAKPHAVYEMLMDSAAHARFTGAEATISRDVGGAFSAYDGALTGTNVELVADVKIVQAWRAGSDDWPEDHYSTATFLLEEAEGGTRLTFTQTEVPETSYDDINQGWRDYYWSKMELALASQ
jgi:activator of HSP90 ATPase